MNSVLFLDIPSIIKTNSKQAFPLHREDWFISNEIKETIKKYVDLNYKVALVGNYPNIAVRKKDINPIENLFTNIAERLELEFKLEPNSINYDYATDIESFEFLPLPGMLYTMAAEYDILLGYSFIITNVVLGKFIQQYSSVKAIIL